MFNGKKSFLFEVVQSYQRQLERERDPKIRAEINGRIQKHLQEIERVNSSMSGPKRNGYM